MPTAVSQISAASAYEQPSIWVSTNAARRSSSSAATRWSRPTAPSSRPRDVAAVLARRAGPGAGAAASRRRIRSAHAQRVIVSSQVRPLDSARNPGRDRYARRKTSWVTSSASSAADEVGGEAPDVGLGPADRGGRARRGPRPDPRRRSRVSSSTAADDTGRPPARAAGRAARRNARSGNQIAAGGRLPRSWTVIVVVPPSPPRSTGRTRVCPPRSVRAHVDGCAGCRRVRRRTRRRCTARPG